MLDNPSITFGVKIPRSFVDVYLKTIAYSCRSINCKLQFVRRLTCTR